ncbi:MAG: hypothetical protein L3K15_09395 [Thermoplasmata archaeon]|nr:hypothetical protein [Thermoplasmata archaeon]
MRLSARRAAWATIVATALLAAAPLAGAGGTGYNLSFSQSANGAVNAGADLISLSSQDNGAGKLTITFQVVGQVVLTSDFYDYYVYFGGTSQATATGFFNIFNNTTVGSLVTSGGTGGGFGTAPITLGGGGTSLSFLVNTSAVGSSATFSLNAVAIYSGPSGASESYIGSAYNGGGNCTQFGCAPTSNVASNFFSGLILWAIIGVVVLVAAVVIIVVVVVVVTRKKRGPPMMGWAPAPGQMMPPPPPPPPPPPGQPPASPPGGPS